VKKIIKFIADLLFPIYCLSCKKEGQWLCDYCLNNINDFSYNNKLLARAIHLYKYQFIKDLAKPLGKLLAKKALNLNYDLIVPVPLHQKRLRWRGFNQAELLAKEIDPAKTINALIKIKNTKAQMRLAKEKRIFNVRDCFVCQDNRVKDKIILLVDDVKTTGSTLKECSRILKQAGVKKVIPLTLLET